MYRTSLCLFLIFAIVFLLCKNISYSSEHKSKVTYKKDIEPIINKYCVVCHGSDKPTLEEFRRNRGYYIRNNIYPRLDAYEHVIVFIKGDDMGALQKRLDDGKNLEDGKHGRMYLYLGKSEAERQKNLQTFKDWLGYWNVKTIDDIKKDIEQEWLVDMLEDGEAEVKDPKKVLSEMSDKIQALEK